MGSMAIRFSTDSAHTSAEVCSFVSTTAPRMPRYLVAVLDWFSRYVLGWELSVTLDGQFCRDTLERALEPGRENHEKRS